MDADAEQEMKNLRRQVELLSKRLEKLETRFAESPAASASETAVSAGASAVCEAVELVPEINSYINGDSTQAKSLEEASSGCQTMPCAHPDAKAAQDHPLEKRRGGVPVEKAYEEAPTEKAYEESPAEKSYEKSSSGKVEEESPSKKTADEESRGKTAQEESPSGKAADVESPSLETRIGLFWLSRLGVGFLVVGVSLLILYSFQYFGSWAKLLTGFLVAVALIGAGEFVDRKQKMKWYGDALAGGGWSLAYFTSYAMHFVSDVKVIADPIMGSSIMLAVAACAVIHSLKKNSELIATLAILLGFITLALTERGIYSATASMILTGALTYLVYERKWISLYSTGFLAAYAFDFFTPNPHHSKDILLKLAYIFPYWLSSALLPLAMGEGSAANKRAVVGIGIVAAVASVMAIQPVFAAFNSHADAYIYAAGAGLYAGLALVMSRRGFSTTALIDGLISLSSLALLIPCLCDGPVELIAWAIQLATIVWAGLNYNLRSFRLFAYPLSLVLFFSCLNQTDDRNVFQLFGLQIPWSALYILPAAIAIAGAAWVYQGERFKSVVSDTVATVSFYWYFHLCAVLWCCLVPLIVSRNFNGTDALGPGFTIIGWSIESLVLALLALKWQRPYLVLVSICGFLLSFAFSMFTTSAIVHVVPVLCSIAMVFSMAFKWRNSKTSAMRAHDLFGVYFVMAVIWLLCYQHMRLETVQWRAYALLTEMLIYIGIGVKYKDVLIRTCGVLSGTILLFAIVFESGLNWATMIPSVAALYAAGHMYRHLLFGDKLDGTRRIVRSYFNCGATLALTMFIGWHLQRYFVSCGWAIEGLLLLSAGFLLSDKLFRISGLAVFALLVCRLFIYDLAEAGTVYRIIAFIVAGVIFMTAAYAYSWFTRKIASVSSKN